MTILSARESDKGCHLMIELIKEIAGDRNAKVAQGVFQVSAKVNDDKIVDNEYIECIFTIQFNSVDISIYWEESGYKNYKRMGLFGQMNTKWQKVKRQENRLYVNGDNYKIRIAF